MACCATNFIVADLYNPRVTVCDDSQTSPVPGSRANFTDPTACGATAAKTAVPLTVFDPIKARSDSNFAQIRSLHDDDNYTSDAENSTANTAENATETSLQRLQFTA